MVGNWKEATLGNEVDLLTGFPFRSEGYTDAVDSVRLVRGDNIVQGALRWDGVKRWPGSESAKYELYQLREGDIVLAMDRPWIEAGLKYAAISKYDLPCLLVQRTARLRGGPKLETRFLRYLIGSPSFTRHVHAITTGTAVPHISGRQVKDFTFLLPPLHEQRAVAHILGTLDAKIELNRRMNETLEAMARALFKSWFVDFDPVRAKAEGRNPGLPQPLADLFPDSFEDSELGEIPRGWDVGCIDDDFVLTMGQSPPGSTYNEAGDGLPFYQGCTDFGFRFPSRRVYCTAPTRVAKRGDTLISVRAPVGDINLAAEDCAIGRGVAAARHKTGARSYSYQFMRSQTEAFDLFEAEGTVFGSIGKRDFHAISCVLPPRMLVMEFEQRISPIDNRIEVAEHEGNTLAALCHELLPRLISGELRVQTVDRDVPALP
jgi:type I restriction enzyme, S subunit